MDVCGIADFSSYKKEMVGMDDGHALSVSLSRFVSAWPCQGGALHGPDGPNPLYLHHYRQLNSGSMDRLLSSRGKSRRKGYRSLPFAASQVVDWRNQKAHISHKHIAELAGIGWIGRNNLLVHPSFGAHVRYNTVLTDMPLDADKPLGTDCGACRDASPSARPPQ